MTKPVRVNPMQVFTYADKHADLFCSAMLLATGATYNCSNSYRFNEIPKGVLDGWNKAAKEGVLNPGMTVGELARAYLLHRWEYLEGKRS